MFVRTPGPGLLLIASVLAGCPRGASENEQFQLWAKYASQEAREEKRVGPPASGGGEVERLQRRLGISDEELLRISRRAEVEKWADSERCRPASEPYYQNELLLAPRPLVPLVGRPTPGACRNRIEGVSIVGAVIDPGGFPQHPTILSGLDPELDEQALATVRESRWYPAMLCGRPVSVHYTMAVPFLLESCERREGLSRFSPGSPARQVCGDPGSGIDGQGDLGAGRSV